MFSTIGSVLSLLLLLFAGGNALAANQTMLATMQFDSVLSVSKSADVSFGSLLAAQAGTYTISPAGNVTATNGGTWLGGNAQAGLLIVSGSTTQTIGVSASNYAANNGVTPNSATCSYDGAAAAPCGLSGLPAPGTGKELKLGVTVVVDGSQPVSSTAAPSFDVVINYN